MQFSKGSRVLKKVMEKKKFRVLGHNVEDSGNGGRVDSSYSGSGSGSGSYRCRLVGLRLVAVACSCLTRVASSSSDSVDNAAQRRNKKKNKSGKNADYFLIAEC